MLRTTSLLSGLVLIAIAAMAAPKAKAETAWLGLVAGPPAGSEAVQAADIASLFEKDQAFRVVPMLGDMGAGNLRLLLNDPASISLSSRPTLLPPRQRRARDCQITSSSWRGSHLRRFTSWRLWRSAVLASLPARK